MMGDVRIRFAIVLAVIAACGGCRAGPPEGQVMAVVNGEEVTRREVTEELRATGGAFTDAAAQQAALDRVIERKLLVEAAREARIDRLASYQIAIMRNDELALAQRYLEGLQPAAVRPDAAAIEARINALPYRYVSRFAVAAADAAGNAMVLDSASIDPQFAERLAAAGIDSWVERPDGARLRLLQRWPVRISRQAMEADAAAALMRERRNAVSEMILERLRKGAQIERQAP